MSRASFCTHPHLVWSMLLCLVVPVMLSDQYESIFSTRGVQQVIQRISSKWEASDVPIPGTFPVRKKARCSVVSLLHICCTLLFCPHLYPWHHPRHHPRPTLEVNSRGQLWRSTLEVNFGGQLWRASTRTENVT